MSEPKLWVVEEEQPDGRWLPCVASVSVLRDFARRDMKVARERFPTLRYRTVQYQRVEPRKKAR